MCSIRQQRVFPPTPSLPSGALQTSTLMAMPTTAKAATAERQPRCSYHDLTAWKIWEMQAGFALSPFFTVSVPAGAETYTLQLPLSVIILG